MCYLKWFLNPFQVNKQDQGLNKTNKNIFKENVILFLMQGNKIPRHHTVFKICQSVQFDAHLKYSHAAGLIVNRTNK